MAKTPLTDKDYEKLGRMLVDLKDSGIVPSKGYYRAAFLRGVVSGLGGVIGATILVGLLLWVLSWFHSVPVVGNLVDTIKHSLSSAK